MHFNNDINKCHVHEIAYGQRSIPELLHLLAIVRT